MMDCRVKRGNDGVFRHCEERSDEAIQFFAPLDCIASLAMTVS
jgi:hypothetical protein